MKTKNTKKQDDGNQEELRELLQQTVELCYYLQQYINNSKNNSDLIDKKIVPLYSTMVKSKEIDLSDLLLDLIITYFIPDGHKLLMLKLYFHDAPELNKHRR